MRAKNKFKNSKVNHIIPNMTLEPLANYQS